MTSGAFTMDLIGSIERKLGIKAVGRVWTDFFIESMFLSRSPSEICVGMTLMFFPLLHSCYERFPL